VSEAGEPGATGADAQPVENSVLADAEPACPNWTIADVYADPDGDWDNDRATNIAEFDNAQDPCEYWQDARATVASADTISAGGPCPSYSLALILEDPSGDWDRDRVSNVDEFYNQADPCVFDAEAAQAAVASGAQPATGPCPEYSLALVLEDATGDWDGDRVTNADEFYNQGDPCVAELVGGTDDPVAPVAQGPCPDYSLALVLEDPEGDWDGDTVSNADEFYASGDPCEFSAENASTETPEEEALRKLNEALNGGLNAQNNNGGDSPVEVTPELVVTGEDGSDVDVTVTNNSGTTTDGDSTDTDTTVTDDDAIDDGDSGPQVTVEVDDGNTTESGQTSDGAAGDTSTGDDTTTDDTGSTDTNTDTGSTDTDTGSTGSTSSDSDSTDRWRSLDQDQCRWQHHHRGRNPGRSRRCRDRGLRYHRDRR